MKSKSKTKNKGIHSVIKKREDVEKLTNDLDGAETLKPKKQRDLRKKKKKNVQHISDTRGPERFLHTNSEFDVHIYKLKQN